MNLDAFSSALEWAEAIKRREVSPLEVLDLYLERIELHEPTLNTYYLRKDDEARTLAKQMGETLANCEDTARLAPFFGVPMPIKGLNDVAGWPNRYCSLGVPEYPAAADDPFVARFRDAGFVFTGLTTSPEFGSVSVTESALCGATRNPWSTDYSPGGSSGGAAAGVAAGMAPIAHGSDGGGSIRGPAAFTGLVGLKTSRGRVPGHLTAWPGISTEGVLSRTVADTAAVLDFQAKVNERHWYVVPPPRRPFREALDQDPKPLRIGVVVRPGFPVEPDTEAANGVAKAVELVEGLGHDVFEIDLGYDQSVFESLFISAWIASHGYLPGVDLTKVEPLTIALNSRAQSLTAIDVAQTVAGMQAMTSAAVEPWVDGSVDVVVTPATPSGPPKVGWLFEDVDTDPMSVLDRAYNHAGFTALFNMFGLPAISLPLHTRADGLPSGVQFVGAPRADWDLLQFAGQVERAAPWRHKVPSQFVS